LAGSGGGRPFVLRADARRRILDRRLKDFGAKPDQARRRCGHPNDRRRRRHRRWPGGLAKRGEPQGNGGRGGLQGSGRRGWDRHGDGVRGDVPELADQGSKAAGNGVERWNGKATVRGRGGRIGDKPARGCLDLAGSGGGRPFVVWMGSGR
jgi:hypothetical protein